MIRDSSARNERDGLEPQLETCALPMPELPQRPARPPQPEIPASKAERDRLRHFADEYVAEAGLTPPVGMDQLQEHGRQVCARAGIDLAHQDFAAILVNNAAWRDTVAAVPFERRLLLLPKCMRVAEHCRASLDEFGLLCGECGLCAIQHLQAEGERLGYVVLVAEGSVVVTQLLETGQIEAVVGVSCMSVLAKCFPHMEARGVPGLAIPLLQDGCADTSADLDWVWEALHWHQPGPARRLELDALRREVRGWFVPETVAQIMGPPEDQTAKIAQDWLVRAGKRWRPYLTVCVYRALECESGVEELRGLDDLKKLALAVECFHKASLIHDDIEDDDEQRYGQRALHVEHGMPVALNVGDFLLGEGYRLIGELEVDDATKVAMLRTAAAGHATLSRGQGADLCWARTPHPLACLQVLDIFRQKTAPAFEVALRLGAFFGKAEAGVHEILTHYSEALGIAYQIRDDLEDFTGDSDSHDLRASRPSVVLALAHERARHRPESEITEALWRRVRTYDDVEDDLKRFIEQHGVLPAAEKLLRSHAARATSALDLLSSATLKVLLRQVVGRIFGDEPMRGYCREFEERHAAGRQLGSEPAA